MVVDESWADELGDGRADDDEVLEEEELVR